MKKVVGLLLLLSSLPSVASATMVIWNIDGTLNIVAPGEGGFPTDPRWASVAEGDTFSIQLTFDSDAPLLSASPLGLGTLYDYDPSSVQFSVRFGSSDPVVFGPVDSSSGYMRIRDDVHIAPEEPAVDMLSFQYGLGFDGFVMSLQLSSPLLDVFSGLGLPSVPDPRLLQSPGFAAIDTFCADTDCGLIAGSVTSIQATVAPTPVPEPASGWLMAIGVLATTTSWRARRNA